ncbi:alpha/beta hydrolase [Aeoliella sp. ICT_H6.2]|uniref:Alpha/beta hydrolase n=1 Tax=Aeoliella straminimaris TaxID=2954799 RepID=A0A9X2FGZ5_9BACT|nr:alpha/beta hydrolase [Aeoliella straminimaris]MCO6044236.1 alpha/beta hydrolase [Aeoliella straminimaris]
MNGRSTLVALALFVSIATQAMGEQATAPAIEPDVVYGHKDGLAMTMDVFRPEGESNQAAILFMVSGGWYSRWAPPEQTRNFLAFYLKEGYTVFAVRHGSSPKYTIPEAVSDVRRAVRFVRQNAERFDIDPNRIGVTGMSAGGHLSLMLGTTGEDGQDDAADPLLKTSSRVQAVVALVPPTDLRVIVWDSSEGQSEYHSFPALNLPMDKAEEFSPLVQVTPDDAPSLVMMGGEDKLVPAVHGTWIDKAMTKAKVPHQLKIVPDVGHNLITATNAAEMQRAMLDWFDKYLLEESAEGK